MHCANERAPGELGGIRLFAKFTAQCAGRCVQWAKPRCLHQLQKQDSWGTLAPPPRGPLPGLCTTLFLFSRLVKHRLAMRAAAGRPAPARAPGCAGQRLRPGSSGAWRNRAFPADRRWGGGHLRPVRSLSAFGNPG